MIFLVVDDDLSMCKLIELYLSPYGKVVYCTQPHDAVQAFSEQVYKNPFDAVLLDIVMPNDDGYRLAHALRNVEQVAGVSYHKRAKLIYVTAHEGKLVPSAASNIMEPDCLINKPFTQESLIADLKAVGLRLVKRRR